VQPVVAIVMGSSSDHEVMADAAAILERFNIAYEIHVVSAHRTPEAMISYGLAARSRGLKVLIAGAGGAAHLPGSVPVATVAINGATNAALLAARILSIDNEILGDALETYRLELADQAGAQDRDLPRT
jgi:5-(carboxyamino)imidazole ribonucleotide mutase